MKKTLLTLLLIPLICLGQQTADPQHRVKVGDAAPDFTLKYLDGKTMVLGLHSRNAAPRTANMDKKQGQ
jgi:hypothetical protein